MKADDSKPRNNLWIGNDIPDFSKIRVLVAGDVMLDSYWHGATSRISPEAPIPVVQIKHEEHRIGGAGNVAINASSMGAHVMLLGLVGADKTSDELEGMLQQSAVKCRLQRIEGSQTIQKLRVLSRNQQIVRLDFEDHFPDWNPVGLLEDYMSALPTTDVVILSDYAKGMFRQVSNLPELARKSGIPVVIDPKGTDFDRYRGATILTPNLAEFEAVVGLCHDDRMLYERAQNLRMALGIEALLITLSERGMCLITAESPPLQIPTVAREVYDVTGAGDTVVAVLGVGLAAGMPMPEVVSLANQAAGIVVSKLGTACVTREELASQLSSKPGLPQLGAMESTIAEFRQRAKAQNKRVVMTNGCFDILHPGHIKYLEEARSLGDYLIVAVNDDDSVRRLKGPTRPINNLDYRMRMLSALASVDRVIAFSEDTPERVITHLLPDILVKGGDYQVDQIAGGAAVVQAGGEVRVLEFLEGYSTTETLGKIRQGGASS